jgi:hypothetical protein
MNTHNLHLICTGAHTHHDINAHRYAYTLHLLRAIKGAFRPLTLAQFIRRAA